MSELVYIGLGANLGDPVVTLRHTIEVLRVISEAPIDVSSLWRSEPIALNEQGSDFINAMVRITTSREPDEILQCLQQLEIDQGRAADHGTSLSRTLDLDIIAFGERIVDDRDLTIPHPCAWKRLFVLLPLSEIDGSFQFPDRQQSLANLIDAAPSMEIERLGP